MATRPSPPPTSCGPTWSLWTCSFPTSTPPDAKSSLPSGGDRAVTVLRHDGVPVAAMVHDPALDEYPELVRAVAATARIRIENERWTSCVSWPVASTR